MSVFFVALGKARLSLGEAGVATRCGISLPSTSHLHVLQSAAGAALDGAAVLSGFLPDATPVHSPAALERYGTYCSSFLFLSGSPGSASCSPAYHLVQALGRDVASGSRCRKWPLERGRRPRTGSRCRSSRAARPALHLCKTHEIDIVNIPISFITEKYLEYLEVMQSMSVDVAAEYLVMAATLAYLKSRELVPTPEPLEAVTEERGGGARPARGADRRLLEYQKYKDAAEKLGGRPIEGRNVFGRGMPIRGGRGDAAAGRAVGLEADRGVREDPGEGRQDEEDPRRVVDRMSIGEPHQPARRPAGGGRRNRSGSRTASTWRCPSWSCATRWW